jgi:LuxR family maltose regulon positive regulatory protein
VSATAAAPSGPVLIATKLHVPEVRPGTVSREALVRRLVEGGDRKLALVCAPPGWGKTILLSEWHASEAESRPFAWVSLDRSDDDPVRFWSYLIGALRTVEPELGEQALATLPSAGPSLVDAVLPSFLNELAGMPRRLVLVLDDYHLVRNELIHASLAFLLRHLPPTLQVAIASRADPPLPLGSLRAEGEVTEIRAAELRFSNREAEALLNGSLALGLDPADVELLQARTEGWAAGLRLAALSVQAKEDKHAFVEAFSGDDRQIGDYLHEVLDDQPAPLRDFLLQTSILERFCAPLCNTVTGRDDAAVQLQSIERSNLFLVPLDVHREWYRYHHLFRDLLQHELVRAGPTLVAELHRRAHAWHLAAGDIDEAIGHATAAGALADAGELIAQHWLWVLNLGQTETLARWIDDLPREAVLGDARLCLARGWVALYLEELDAAARWREAAERAPLPGPVASGLPPVAAHAAILEAVHAHATGDVVRHVGAARRAVSLVDPTYGGAVVTLGGSLYDAGQYREAARALERAMLLLPAEGWLRPRVFGLGYLAAAYADLGEVDRAERAATDAERLVAEHELGEAPWVACTRFARGKLLELTGDTAAAQAAYARAVVLARRGRWRLDLAHALLLLARLERRRDHAAARAHAREAREVLAACPDPGMLGELLANTERALLLAPPRRAAAGLPADPELSERELTVLRMLGSELSQREIGSELYVSFNTVKAHTRSIFRKLGVSTRAEAVARGCELGLL